VINRKYIHLFYLLGLLLAATSVRAQSDAVAAFDSGYVETGNPFILHLSVPEQFGQPERIDFSSWDTLLPAKNTLKQTGWQRENGRWVNSFTLISFDSAQLDLPPLRLFFAGGDQLETNPLRVTVLPTPAPDEPSQMLDIKDIYREPWHWLDFLVRLWPVFVAVLLLAFAIWWLLLRNKKTGLKAERRIQLPPHELALRKLAELEKQHHWQQGRLKTYYSQLTYIAREYLERRYHIPALESSSDEILRLLKKTDMPRALTKPLAELLQWADLAKFAKGSPPATYHTQAFGEVQQLIEHTKPLEPANEQAILNT
jgi:hypothetical protein